MHSVDVVHTDLKPGNILINADSDLQICDLGRAFIDLPGYRRVYDAEHIKKHKLRYGTSTYRAPEVFLGYFDFGKPMDVWALGLVCLEMVTLVPFFKNGSDADMLRQIFDAVGKVPHHTQLFFLQNLPKWREGLVPEVPSGSLLACMKRHLCKEAVDWLRPMLTISPEPRHTMDDAARMLRPLASLFDTCLA